jgi:hypothetical protein
MTTKNSTRAALMELARELSPEDRMGREELGRRATELLRDFYHSPVNRAFRLLSEAGLLDGVMGLAPGDAVDPEVYLFAVELAEVLGPDHRHGERTKALEGLREFAEERHQTYHVAEERIANLLMNLACLDEPEEVIWRYADAVLQGEEGIPSQYRDQLARAILEAAKRLVERLRSLKPDEEGAVDGMFWLDAGAIDWMEVEGFEFPNGIESAKSLARQRRRTEPESLERLGLWLESEERFPLILWPLRFVGEHIWKTDIRERWLRFKDSVPAVTLEAFGNIERAALRPNRGSEPFGERQMCLFEGGELVATTSILPAEDYERLQAVISKGTEELRTMTAIRFMGKLIQECHDRRISGVQDPTIFLFEGWTEMAEWIGATGKRALDRLPRILEGGSKWQFSWEGGQAIGLWTVFIRDGVSRPQGGHTPPLIEVRVGAPLAPLWTFEGGSRGLLVPVVELPELDKKTKKFMPAQAAFAWAIVRELTEYSAEIVKYRGVELSPAKIERVAARVGCPKATAYRLMEWWTDPSRGQAFLEAVSPGRYHLADNQTYGGARRHLEEAGKRSRNGTLMGLRSASKRKRGNGKRR